MNKRRKLVIALGFAFVPVFGFAQRRVPVIGYLSLAPISEPPQREWRAFLDGLRQYGYTVDKNIRLVYRSAEGNLEFIDEMAQDLTRQKVDIIVTYGAPGVLAVRRATKTIPVVFLSVGDPVGIGAVASLGRPGGNVTGVSFISTELAAKRMEMLKEVVPACRRVAILWDPRNGGAQLETDSAVAAARQLSMTPEQVPVESDGDLNAALQRLAARKPDAIYVSFSAGPTLDNRSVIAEFGLRHRLPVISGWDLMTEGGGLLSYGANLPLMFRRGAYFVDRILRGTKPSDLPVEQPMTFELVVNMKTAKALGITIPPTILVWATRLIE